MPLRRPSLRASLIAAGLFVGLSCGGGSTEPAEVTQITFSSNAISMDAFGATQPLVPTVRDQRGKAMSATGITWSTNTPAVATVSASGVVTAVANGTANITASLDGVDGVVQVTVLQLPVAPVIVAGNLQTGQVTQQLATTLQVRTQDRLGNVMAGLAVTFAVTSGGGSLGTSNATSDAGGLASTTWTLGTSTSLLQRVTASVQGVVATTLFSATPSPGPAFAMNLAPGNGANGQSVTISTAVPIKPAVQIVDNLGNGVPGQTVNFAVTAGGGSGTGLAAVTDAGGIATVGTWTVGAVEGVNTMTATYSSLTPIIFTVNGIGDPCTPSGATTISIGTTVNGTMTNTDCQIPTLQRYDYYRFTLASQTSLIITMNSSAVDSYLQLYDFGTQALIAENDDIILGVDQNSRIAITLNAGSYLLRARTFDPGQTGAYTMLARLARLGVASQVIINGGQGQVAAPGVAPVAPSVKVTDDLDAPVAGVTVTFATVPGIGGVTGGTAVTNAQGIAAPTSWSLSAGANVVSATVTGDSVLGNPQIISATGKASTAGFDIGLRFATMPTLSQLQTFSDAAARWEAIITGDIGQQALQVAAGTCNSPVAINETVDDVIIVVRLEPIDGAGAVLGSAGPCFIRPGGFVPTSQASLSVMGSMRFDTADLAGLEAAGSFGSVILHEMGHVLGIGTLWSTKGLLQLPSPTSGTGLDTHFNGPLAITAFNTVGGSTYTGGNKVPVENSQGGAGTRNSHWREGVLQNELMTGFLNSGAGVTNPLSVLTIQSLADIGYSVNTAAADAFFVTTTLMAPGAQPREPIEMYKDVRDGPVYEVARNGRPIGMPEPAVTAPQRPRSNKKPR